MPLWTGLGRSGDGMAMMEVMDENLVDLLGRPGGLTVTPTARGPPGLDRIHHREKPPTRSRPAASAVSGLGIMCNRTTSGDQGTRPASGSSDGHIWIGIDVLRHL